jgi:large subunit ribosomal protein L4
MKAPLFTKEGKENGTVELPKTVFDIPLNTNMLHDVVVAMQSNARAGNAHTKMRGEVSGTGKKPWRQKGTGRARHGSTRSPIWVGGGIAHGPRSEKDYSKKINKKVKRKALLMALSQKARAGQVLFVEALPSEVGKTKDAATLLKNLSKNKGFEKIAYKKGSRALVYNTAHDTKVVKMFQNIPSAHVEEARNANPLDVLAYGYVIFVNPPVALKTLAKE